jgi:hypothetical protein
LYIFIQFWDVAPAGWKLVGSWLEACSAQGCIGPTHHSSRRSVSLQASSDPSFSAVINPLEPSLKFRQYNTSGQEDKENSHSFGRSGYTRHLVGLDKSSRSVLKHSAFNSA